MNRLPEADQPYCGGRAAPSVSADSSALGRSMPLLAVLLSACIVLPPEGPSVMVLPGSGQRFEQFRADDAMCRNYASQAIGPRTPQSAAVDAGVASAALGTVIGAALGAAVGAGLGLLAGSSSGVAAGNASSYTLQRRYDQNYLQCMYSRGHKVPLPVGYPLRESSASRPVAPGFVPPPPRGTPPPPPPPLGAPPPPPPR